MNNSRQNSKQQRKCASLRLRTRQDVDTLVNYGLNQIDNFADNSCEGSGGFGGGEFLAFELVDVPQHLGHGGVLLDRDGLAYVDVLVESLGQVLAFHDGHIVLQSQAANPLGDRAS